MSFESWISLLQFGAKNDQFNQLHQKLQFNLVINVIVLPILIILIEIWVGYHHLEEPNHAWWVSLSSVRTSLFNKGKEFVKWFKDVQCTISSTEQWINEGSLRCSISRDILVLNWWFLNWTELEYLKDVWCEEVSVCALILMFEILT